MTKNKTQIMPETNIENPIVVAMSGGVDSSVAAALMKKKASNVMGVTLKLYDEKKVKNSLEELGLHCDDMHVLGVFEADKYRDK